MNLLKHKIKSFILIFVMLAISLGTLPGFAATVYAGKQCGTGASEVTTSIDLGCVGKGNSISDLLFAIIRLLSDGVGIVIIASVVVAGIQYTVSRGDPQATANAVTRIQSSFIALLIFIFGWALLQWLVPGGVFSS